MDIALGQLEIRTYIGAYLDNRAIQACRLVNREWSISFALFFWRDCRLPPNEFMLSLAQNAPHVRYLHLSDATPPEALQHLCGLPQLKMLTLSGTDEHLFWSSMDRVLSNLIQQRLQRVSFKDISDFLTRHRHCWSLRSLQLENTHMVDLSGFWKAVTVGCPELRVLKVTGVFIGEEASEEMWRTICRTGVEELGLSNIKSSGRLLFAGVLLDTKEKQLSREDSLLSKIKRLQWWIQHGSESRQLLTLLRLCPDLRDFEFPGIVENDFAKEFAELVKRGTWNKWESFGCTSTKISNQVIAEIIQAIPRRIKKLIFGYNASFGPSEFEALRAHKHGGLLWIQELKLRGCTKLTSSMIQTILEEAPVLVVLSASLLESKDILKGKDWLCTRTLESLHVSIFLTTKEHHQEVLKRIGALTRLRTLKLGSRLNRALQMALTLRRSVEPLGTLRVLEDFDGLDSALPYTEADLAWMTKHWPRICDVELLTKLPFEIRDPELVEILRQRNITFGG